MGSSDLDRILDFAPIGMWWEVTRSTADTGGEAFESFNVLAPGFGEPHCTRTPRPSWTVTVSTIAFIR
jgi:hypothetical protein